ncbi:MAG: hypothetical protein HKP13_05035 [Gammaproteobacteria bacterium]|nr:hypothetical protein [Gammaproteobacteria bacterium]
MKTVARHFSISGWEKLMSIDARTAAKTAATYYEAISGEPAKLTIEEIELDEDNRFWFITLGISDGYGGAGIIGSIGSMGSRIRDYKIFKIDSNTGEVKSMKIRKV